jgi:light-regulated signal transduction histidine kinase (bacteriophytochrome)
MSADDASRKREPDGVVLAGGRDDEQRAVEAILEPVRHLGGLVDQLRRRTDVAYDETTRRHLDAIARSAAQVGQRLDELRAYSRLATAEMAPVRVGLSRLVREVVAELRATGDVEWQVRELPEVSADPRLLRLALFHLLRNALKYTRTRERPRIEIGARAAGADHVVLYVRDNGVGFDPASAERLFGVFQRLHPAGEWEGAGMGLATVRRIVERHGGRVWAEGAVDEGATFSVGLPRPRDEA